MADPNDQLNQATAALSTALLAADAAAGEGLCDSDAWSVRRSSIRRLFRSASKRPFGLKPVQTVINGDRAGVRARITPGVERFWLAFQQDNTGTWRCLAASESWPQVGLFVAGQLELYPHWHALPSDEAVQALAEQAVASIGVGATAPAGASADAWDELTAAIDGEVLDPAVGMVVALPGANRAAFQLVFCEPGDDFVVEDRWAILERGGPETEWVLRGCSGIGTMEALLDGLDVPGETPDP